MSSAARKYALTLSFAIATWGSACAQEASLPGGAASLREVHGDWTVSCAIQPQAEGKPGKTCVLSQEQFQPQARQRVLAIELRLETGGVKGALVMPFGLSLKNGVTYQLDEGQAGSVQDFRTCLPVGCLIDIDFDSRTVASLTSGKSLKITGTGDNGQEIAFSISLTGFASALARLEALAT